MRLAGLAGLLACAAAVAQEFRPHAQARIDAVQWQAYFDQVSSLHARTRTEAAGRHLVEFRDDAAHVRWVFTLPGHAAHPAWVTRRLQQEGTQVAVRQVGFYAGELAPFTELFESYLRASERLKQELNAPPPASVL